MANAKLPTKEQVLKYAPLALLAFGALAWLVTLGGSFRLKKLGFSNFHFFSTSPFFVPFCFAPSRGLLRKSSLSRSLALALLHRAKKIRPRPFTLKKTNAEKKTHL